MSRFSNLYLRRRYDAVVRAARTATFQPPPSETIALGKLRDALPSDPVCVDVGANIGDWTKALLAHYPQAHVLLLEAQAELKAGLDEIAAAHPRVQARTAALAAEPGEATFYVTLGDRNRTGSSLLPELTGVELEERKVPTFTLDSLVAEAKLPRPVEFLKMDTQGSELDILQGGTETLASATLVQLELSLVPYNEGAPVLADVIEFMSDHGFAMRDLFDLMYVPGTDALNQLNGIFTRRPRTLDEIMRR